MCPGPLILGAVADFNTLASTAITGGPLLMLCFVFIGTAVAQQVSKNMCPAVKPVANASVETMANAILDSNAIVLDIRSADEREVSHAAPFEGMYECYEGKDTANMVYFLVLFGAVAVLVLVLVVASFFVGLHFPVRFSHV